ncbi:MAG: tetratricopeptide repeat protein [Bacteroidota bacterium]|nr:tetratricopeptide repeat protein [Bacteroidota bacterium]
MSTCRVLGFYKAACLKGLFSFISFYLFIFSSTSFAQRNQIDSLQMILPSLEDTSRIDCMNALSSQYIRLLVRDSAQYFEALAYQESKALGYIHGIAASVTNQSGIVEYFDNDLIKSEALARESIGWFEKTNNKNGIENTYNNLSFAAFGQSKYDEAYQIVKWQYEKSLTAKDTVLMYHALSSIGVIHYQEGNYDSAFYFYQKAHQIAIVQKNDVWLSGDLIGFGTLFREIGDYNSALNYYQEVFKTDTRETIQSRIDAYNETWTRMEYAELFSLLHQYDSAWHYYHLFDTTKITDKDLRVYLVSTGETYLLQKDYQRALQNFLRGLGMHRKLNDRNEIKRVLLDIAKTYFALNNNKAALQYAREGLNMSLQTKSRQFIRDGYKVFYLVYDRLHKADSTYLYYQKYIAIKDVVVSDQTKGKFAAYKYEEQINSINNEKLISEQQLKIKQQELSQSSFQKKILITGFICLLIISGIIFRTILFKRKNEKSLRELAENELQIQKLESQKKLSKLEMQALRAQMNPHFIFNSLSAINLFILENNRLQASEYLSKFARLVRLILQNSQEAFIPLERELEALQLYLELESLRYENKFTYKINTGDVPDITLIKVPPLIIQPYVENAIWHGLMHLPGREAGKKESGHLEIELYTEGSFLFCKIMDDGIGRKKAAELKSKSALAYKSMGMNITADRIAMLQQQNQLGTHIVINDLVLADGSAGGTEVIIKIPF